MVVCLSAKMSFSQRRRDAKIHKKYLVSADFLSCHFKFGILLIKLITAIAIISITVMQPCYAIVATDILQPSVDNDYVVDLAGILDRDTVEVLNTEIEQLHQSKQKSIYLVTVDEIEQKPVQKLYKIVPPVSSSRRFLESILLNWNIDDLKRGNSILFLVSVLDRSVEIRSGYNLKYIIHDRHIQGVIDKLIIPKFKQNNFAEGILVGTKALITKTDNPYYSELPYPENPVWESQVRSECKSRNLPSPKAGYTYTCPNEVSYHGGSGTW